MRCQGGQGRRSPFTRTTQCTGQCGGISQRRTCESAEDIAIRRACAFAQCLWCPQPPGLCPLIDIRCTPLPAPASHTRTDAPAKGAFCGTTPRCPCAVPMLVPHRPPTNPAHNRRHWSRGKGRGVGWARRLHTSRRPRAPFRSLQNQRGAHLAVGGGWRLVVAGAVLHLKKIIGLLRDTPERGLTCGMSIPMIYQPSPCNSYSHVQPHLRPPPPVGTWSNRSKMTVPVPPPPPAACGTHREMGVGGGGRLHCNTQMV